VSDSEDLFEVIDVIFPRGLGLVVMLVFSDLGRRSLDLTNIQADEVICVSAVVFKDTPYKQFCRPWNRFLKRWGASAFHATDFYSGTSEFDREDNTKRMDDYLADSKLLPRCSAPR